MLTCIACSKQSLGTGSQTRQDLEESDAVSTPRSRQAIKTLTAQIKDIALKASGAYKHCKPCSGSSNRNSQNNEYTGFDAAVSIPERFHCSYTAISTPRMWKKDMEARLKDLSSAEGTPSTASISGRTTESAVFIEEDEVKEWVAQVEPGILITFVSRPQGGNDMKRISFSRDMFNKSRAQRWWTENYEKVMELYNVHERLNEEEEEEETPMTTPQRSDNEGSKVESDKKNGLVMTSTSPIHSCCVHNPAISPSTPRHSNMNGRKINDGSSSVRRSSSSRGETDDHRSISNASEMETEWVEQDEPGVYITIRALPDGTKELRRVRFSRERFGEMHARLWWEQNRGRIQEQYL